MTSRSNGGGRIISTKRDDTTRDLQLDLFISEMVRAYLHARLLEARREIKRLGGTPPPADVSTFFTFVSEDTRSAIERMLRERGIDKTALDRLFSPQ